MSKTLAYTAIWFIHSFLSTGLGAPNTGIDKEKEFDAIIAINLIADFSIFLLYSIISYAYFR